MVTEYKVNAPVTVWQFVELLRESGLGQRRPIDDLECMAGMIRNGNLLVTAWIQRELVGIARSITDFHYVCYLCDLAVHKRHQRRGIGIQLQRITQRQLG